MPKELFTTTGGRLTLRTSEIRYKISAIDIEIFRLMAAADFLEPSAFLQWLIREEAERRGMWPPELEEGEEDLAAHRRGVPPAPAVLMAKPVKKSE